MPVVMEGEMVATSGMIKMMGGNDDGLDGDERRLECGDLRGEGEETGELKEPEDAEEPVDEQLLKLNPAVPDLLAGSK